MRSCWWPLIVAAIFWLASSVKAQNVPSQIGTANPRARLQKRLVEFEALKAEIAELEELAGVPHPQYMVRIQLIELSLTKQRNVAAEGVPIVSLDSPGDAKANATVVTGWLANKFAKVLVDQTLTSVDGRQASTFIAGTKTRRAHANIIERPPPSLPIIDDCRIDITPTLRPDGRVQVAFDVCRGNLPSVGGTEANGESAPEQLNERWQSSIVMVPGESVVAARTSTTRQGSQACSIAFGFAKMQYTVNEIDTLLLVTLEPPKQLVQRRPPIKCIGSA
ncbi:MAG: hypothetical protein ACYC96_16920 [Fimbriimonadaceae bacterium]